jgi:dihydroorotase
MFHAGAVAFSDDGRCVQDAGVMRRVMDYAKMFPITLMSHCQDDSLAGRGAVNEGVVSTRLGLPGYPAEAEELMIARDIALCGLTGCRVHFQHVSTGRGIGLVRAAKAAGLPLTCEVTPHHLFLDEDMLDLNYDTNRKMNPPLRTSADRAALLDGLLDGTVDAIATDHAPHAPHEKQLEFELAPFGTTGLETALSLVNTHLVATGKVTWSQVAQWMCHGPRSCVPRIPEQRIEVGRPGTLTVVDPEARVEVTAEWFVGKSRNSAFLGAKLLGKATEVLVAGQWALRGGKVVEG